MQHFTYLHAGKEFSVNLPSADDAVISGVQWGDPCELFSPAYWYTQYLMSNPRPKLRMSYRLGCTFSEEVTVCLLGGHGIPAEVGLAAFKRLKDDGLIADLCTDRTLLQSRLREPLTVNGRRITYRFWRRKSSCLADVYAWLRTERAVSSDPRELRNRLLALPGIGLKTASWIVRNWLASDEVAILDIHVVRAGVLANIFSKQDNVSRQYLQMEARFIAFAKALGVPTSALDVLIWTLMRATPRIVMREFDRVTCSRPLRPVLQSKPDQLPLG